MPGYKTHLIGGLVVFLIGMTLAFKFLWTDNVPYFWVLACFLVSLWTSIFPDVDVRTSVAFKIWAVAFTSSLLAFLIVITLSSKGITSWVIGANYYFVAILITALFLASLFLRHRKIMHTFGMAAVFSLGLFMLDPVLVPFSFAGYSSHLLLDRWVKSDD